MYTLVFIWQVKCLWQMVHILLGLAKVRMGILLFDLVLFSQKGF